MEWTDVFLTSTSEAVNLIHGATIEGLNGDISSNATLRANGVQAVPGSLSLDLRTFVERLLEHTRQGASLDGVTARLTYKEPETDATVPSGMYVSGRSIEIQLPNKSAIFEIGIGKDLTPGGLWYAYYDSELPTEDERKSTGVAQEASVSPVSHCGDNTKTTHTAPEMASTQEDGDTTRIGAEPSTTAKDA